MAPQKKYYKSPETKNQLLIETYDQIADDYYKQREDMVLTEEMEHFLGSLSGTDILDAGCGNGRDSIIFHQRGYHVHAIDYSENQLKIARSRKDAEKLKFLRMNILNLSFSENNFDGIWCCAVLSHFYLQEVCHILKSFYKILKDGGILFFTVKKGSGECYFDESEFPGIQRFTSFFSESGIRTLLKQSGFRATSLYTYNEREKFCTKNRDIDFLVVYCAKDARTDQAEAAKYSDKK